MARRGSDDEIRARFAGMAQPFQQEPIQVSARALSSKEAIGIPPRDDFPLVRGKEKIIEANFKGFRAHAFSAAEVEFSGTLGEIVNLPLDRIPKRAVFFAALNAFLAFQGKIRRTVHCRDEDPMLCGEKLGDSVFGISPPPKSIALIGYQPGMMKSLASVCGDRGIRFEVTDMNTKNIGNETFGVTIRDGTENERAIQEAEHVFCTGSTIVNGSIWNILDWCDKYSTRVVFFGVTIQGPAVLMGWETFCPFGRSPHDTPIQE